MGLQQAVEMMSCFPICEGPAAGFLPLPKAAATPVAQNFGGGSAAC
jgi:hypothetical protein